MVAPSGTNEPPSAVSCDTPASTSPQNPPAPKKRAIDRTPDNGEAPDANVEEMDETFTLVSYKKKRNTGIPVLFQPSQAGCSLWRANPNVVAADIVVAAQEKVLAHRFNKDGSLVVNVSSLSAANRLLQVPTLAGIAVEARVPQSYMATYGKIQAVPLEYTDEELGSYLCDQGVLSARRQVSYSRNEDSVVTETRRRSVILEFKAGTPLPARVFLGFCSFPVTEYMGAATQCFKCQRHGHIAKNCRGPIRCKVCSGSHSYKDCTSRAQPRCANCGGPHPASYGACPKKKAATLARNVELIQGKVTTRREPSPNPELVFTTALQASQDPQTKRSPSSNKSYADVVQEQSSTENSRVPSDARSKDTSSPSKRRSHRDNGESSSQTDQTDIVNMLIPMLFAAIKALLRTNPSSQRFPEVEAVLALEPLIASTFTAQQRSGRSQQ